MSWIEFHPSKILKLKKFSDLRRALNIRANECLGLLGRLWGETIEIRESGDISDWTPEYLCELIDTRLDAKLVWKALVDNRWIDCKDNGKVLIHDWLVYTGRYLEAKYRTSNPEVLHKTWDLHGREYLKVPGAKNPDGWTHTRIKVLKRDGNACRYCGAHDVPLEIDHVIPFSKGGTNSFDNLVAACRPCNRSKGDRFKPVPSLTKDGPPSPSLPLPSKPEKKRGTTKRFVKPSAEEVFQYAQSLNFKLNGQQFCDYYETKGWVVGKSPMKDWKAAVRTWYRRHLDEHPQASSRPDPDRDRKMKEREEELRRLAERDLEKRKSTNLGVVNA